jgi:hypothetical protein
VSKSVLTSSEGSGSVSFSKSSREEVQATKILEGMHIPACFACTAAIDQPKHARCFLLWKRASLPLHRGWADQSFRGSGWTQIVGVLSSGELHQ